LYTVALFSGTEYDFNIENKSVSNAFAIQVPCGIAFVYFEAALCIGVFGGDFHIVNHKPMEHFGADPPI
jgi:hypothetical protein